MLTILTLGLLWISSALGKDSSEVTEDVSSAYIGDIAEFTVDLSRLKEDHFSGLNLAIDENFDALCGALEGFNPNEELSYQAVLDVGEKLKPMITLLALADGTVIYDARHGHHNTFENAKNKVITENHNNRLSIISAQLNNKGMAFEEKLSTTTNTHTDYVSRRCGLQYASSGTIRLSNTL
eukprot:418373_1